MSFFELLGRCVCYTALFAGIAYITIFYIYPIMEYNKYKRILKKLIKNIIELDFQYRAYKIREDFCVSQGIDHNIPFDFSYNSPELVCETDALSQKNFLAYLVECIDIVEGILNVIPKDFLELFEMDEYFNRLHEIHQFVNKQKIYHAEKNNL